MGLFDFFKSEKKSEMSTSENGVLGPTFLEGNTIPVVNPKKMHDHEWRRKLKTPQGETKFRLKYYGEIFKEYNLVVGTEIAPIKIVAVDISNNTEIVLFDGCIHGYNAMFCDVYTPELVESRIADKNYKDVNGNEIFEIIISTYNGIDYQEEFIEEVDEDGNITLINGTKMDFEEVKRNGFDTIQVLGINEQGKKVEIVSEETA